EQTFAELEVEDLTDEVCSCCHGSRLNPQARAVRFDKTGIADVAALSVKDVRRWVETLQVEGALSTREQGIARDLIPEIRSRLEFLEEVGLGYLTLDRGAPTLSGGEAQRIRLAAQLGSNLQGVCYVLDEPTIGLHARDNQILLDALHKLGNKGNTLVVVEHDEDTIRRADHIIDIGPSAGKRGGRLVAQGSVEDVTLAEDSQTGRYLLHAMKHPLKPRRAVGEMDDVLAVERPVYESAKDKAKKAKALLKRLAKGVEAEPVADDGIAPVPPQHFLRLKGADLHNLDDVDVDVPLQRLVVVTGVSGSGKSTLARDVLLHNVQAAVQQRSTKAGRDADDAGKRPKWSGCKSVDGYQLVDRVLEVDHTPIG
ncbi:MAG: excinuclease ABC subunit A, partial [Comamonadaceae bacterium]